MSPWLDLRVPPKEMKLPMVEAQTNRRFLKTHLPLDALVYSPKAKYTYIGRDSRDVVWSMYNHHANANALWYEALNDTPGRVGPPIESPPADVREYFQDWMDRDGHPFWVRVVNEQHATSIATKVAVADLGEECARWLANGTQLTRWTSFGDGSFSGA